MYQNFPSRNIVTSHRDHDSYITTSIQQRLANSNRISFANNKLRLSQNQDSNINNQKVVLQKHARHGGDMKKVHNHKNLLRHCDYIFAVIPSSSLRRSFLFTMNVEHVTSSSQKKHHLCMNVLINMYTTFCNKTIAV